MPQEYTVKDARTGKTITFQWTGDQPPTDADFEEVFAAARSSAPSGSALSRFTEGAASNLNPIAAMEFLGNVAKGLLPTSGGAEARSAVGRAVVDPAVAQLDQVASAYREGRPLAALGHAAGAVPIVGPSVAQIVEQVQRGDVAGGAGALTGLLAPFVAPPLLKGGVKGLAAVAPQTAGKLASTLDASAAERLADVMSPKVGRNKVRYGNRAVEIAPALAREPGLDAFSREGLHAGVADKLAEARAALDDAADHRLVSQQVKTGPLVGAIQQLIDRLTAQPVEGSHALPAVTGPAVRVTPTDQMRLYALRWIKDDMEALPYVSRTWSEAPRKSGNAAGGDMNIAAGAAGAPIYRAIVGAEGHEVIKASRAQVIKAINDLIEGKESSSKLHGLVSDVAAQLAQGNPRLQRLMATGGPSAEQPAAYVREVTSGKPADMPAVSAVSLGSSVEPGPNAAQIATLRKIQNEIRSLGPVASYESIRRIRAAWDQVAEIKYLPSTTQDALTSRGEATAAERATAAMRDALASADEGTAAANARFHLFKSANDVLDATKETERVRPKVGRGLVARATGAMIGAKEGGIAGAGLGAVVGELANRAAEAAPTFQIMIARRLAAVADALRRGDTAAADQIVTGTVRRFPAVKTGLRVTGKLAAPAGRLSEAVPLAAQDETN